MMYGISTDWVIEQRIYAKDGVADKVIVELTWASGWVVIDDERFDPAKYKDADVILVSDYAQDDSSFEDGDGYTLACETDPELAERLTEEFDENGVFFEEGLGAGGWREVDCIVEFNGFEIEEIDESDESDD